MAPICWIEVVVPATAEAVDWVRMGLSSLPQSPTVRFAVTLTPAVQDNSDWPYQLSLWFPDNSLGRSQWQALQQKLSPLQRSGLIGAPDLRSDPIFGQEPVSPSSPLQHLGRFVILPTGSNFLVPADKLGIWLQPSASFGSGYHPATILSLQLIERYLPPQGAKSQKRVLDLGTGSGILGLACARLGAQVLALDNDPMAIQACRAAITENGLSRQMRAQVGSLGEGNQFGHWLGDDYVAEEAPFSSGEPPDQVGISQAATFNQEQVLGENVEVFDMIVANLLARLHVALAADYAACLKLADSGLLITAGYTQDYQPTLEETFHAAGFRLKDQVTSQEWVALAHEYVG
jgi:ribosomal protein L11 methyltransferase